MNLTKLFALFGATILLSNYLPAQDDVDIEDADEVEEVVVTGIKRSLLDAIDIKRSNTGIVDAITTEDFGKFPDNNLAESLARLVGVGIDRSNLEGERVAVRGFGPDLNLVTLNGRQMPTAPTLYEGGRSFNFGDVTSLGIQAVEVYKSTNSRLPSGGIGSTINIVTTKPLSVDGQINALNVNVVDDSTSNEGQTGEIQYLHAVNKGSWGYSVSLSHQDRNNVEEGTRESNWITVEEQFLTEGYYRVDKNAAGITNNNARPDGRTFYQEPSAYLIKDNNRYRENYQATLQFIPVESILVTTDWTRSNVDFDSTGQLFGSWLGGWTTQSGTINPNGVYTDVVVGERGYDHTFIWGDTKTTNESVGINIEFTLSDSLSFDFDYHDSFARVDGTTLPNEMGFVTPADANVTHTNGGASGIHTFTYDREFTASDFSHSGLLYRDQYKENEMHQIQINGAWTNLGDGFIKTIEFGISDVESAFTDTRSELNTPLAPVVAADSSIFKKVLFGDFMDGFNPNFGTNYYFEIDPSAAINAWTTNVGPFSAGPIDTNDRVVEQLKSAFVQANMEFIVDDRPLNVVAGLRYEESDTTSVGLEAVPSRIRWDMIEGLTYLSGGIIDSPKKGSNDILLPQIAMAYSLDDQQVLRFSIGKSMGRPSLGDLRSSLFFSNRNYLTPTASGGNPNLEPLVSENLDLAYEYYYDEGSYLAINYFMKEIEDFTSSGTSTSSLYGLTNPAQSEIGLYAQSCVQAWDVAGRPDPGFPGEWGSAHCVSQQALWSQSWMNLYQHMGWVAVAMSRGVDVSNGFPYGQCEYGGWWRCEPGYVDGGPNDPLALFEITRPLNLEAGEVDGFEVVVQHLFADTGFGIVFNATFVESGDVEVDRYQIGRQFLLPGLGDSGNLSVFYEDEKITARIALNHRGETVVGFGNYDQPLFVEERDQIDASFSYRLNENASVYLEVQNLNDEPTRLHVRYPEMLFLAQDHGPISRLGFRYKF